MASPAGRRAVGVLLALAATNAFPADRFALILRDPPVAEQFRSTAGVRTAAATARRDVIRAAQARLRSELQARRIPATGAAQLLFNAVFVQTAAEREAELRSLPGVVSVVPVRRHKPQLNRALDMANVPAAWQTIGGPENAGKGVKIGIIDTGIDIGHAAFSDEGYDRLEGYPTCSGFSADENCAEFTNRKVIVARSYVSQLAAEGNGAADDFTPRDRIGHGTATAAVAAATPVTGPFGTMLRGAAPRAYLGAYRIFGSPGVNEFTTDDVVIQAFEDALADGMDVVSFSVGSAAMTAPLARTCGPKGDDICDLLATAVDRLIDQGMLIVAAAGNDGTKGINETGENVSTAGSITSPATLTRVLSVGAVNSTRQFSPTLLLSGDTVPNGAVRLPAYFAYESEVSEPLTAPAVDVTTIGNDGRLCTPLMGNLLAGRIAVIARGECTFRRKADHAVEAGAIGLIFYQAGPDPFTTYISVGISDPPAVIISAEDGRRLLEALAKNPAQKITLDPATAENDAPNGNMIASFSSRGPTLGEGLPKPDVVATGTTMLLPTQAQDPDGLMYSDTAYTMADGTSFAAPLVAGVAALVRQVHPEYTAAQIRSVLVNTASTEIKSADGRARVSEAGAGQIDAKKALGSSIAAEPTSIAFGILNRATTFPLKRTLILSNIGRSPVMVSLSVDAPILSGPVKVSVEPSVVSLNAGRTATVTVTLSGSLPDPGHYDGYVRVSGNAPAILIPYLFSISDERPVTLVPITGDGFVGVISRKLDSALAIRVTDRYGIGVKGVPVSFVPLSQRGRITEADRETNEFGIAHAVPTMPSTVGSVRILVAANFGELQYEFDGSAEAIPVVTQTMDAADRKRKALVPGSLVTVIGTGLSSLNDQAPAGRLPMALDAVTASFYAGEHSWPGLVQFVSPGEITVQVPWELHGRTSAQLRIGKGGIFSERLDIAIATLAAPSVFTQIDDTGLPVADAMGMDDQPTGLESNPALRGRPIALYVNGLGPVKDRSNAASETIVMPDILVGGVPASVLSSGLSPERAGYYRVIVEIGAATPPGLQELVLTAGAAKSEPVKINVR